MGGGGWHSRVEPGTFYCLRKKTDPQGHPALAVLNSGGQLYQELGLGHEHKSQRPSSKGDSWGKGH